MASRYDCQGIRRDLPAWAIRWALATLLLLFIVYPRNSLAFGPAPSGHREYVKDMVKEQKIHIHAALLPNNFMATAKALIMPQQIAPRLPPQFPSTTPQVLPVPRNIHDYMEEAAVTSGGKVSDLERSTVSAHPVYTEAPPNPRIMNLKNSDIFARHVPCYSVKDIYVCPPQEKVPIPDCDGPASTVVGGSKHVVPGRLCPRGETRKPQTARSEDPRTSLWTTTEIDNLPGIRGQEYSSTSKREHWAAPEQWVSLKIADPPGDDSSIARPFPIKINMLTRCQTRNHGRCYLSEMEIISGSGVNVDEHKVRCRGYEDISGMIPATEIFSLYKKATISTQYIDIGSLLCYIMNEDEGHTPAQPPRPKSKSLSLHLDLKRSFDWSELVHPKECDTSQGYTLLACKQHQMLLYIVYFVAGLTTFCGVSWMLFRCFNKPQRRVPLLTSYKSESEQSLVRSKPMTRIRAHGMKMNDPEGQMGSERLVGLDGAADGWGKWLKQKSRPQISGRFSPAPRTFTPRFPTPRIPSLALPKMTLATVRQFGGLARGSEAATMREMMKDKKTVPRDVTRLRWGSTI